VTVNLRTGRSSGDQGVDKLIRIENIRGSDFNDTLIGNAASNRLIGAGGKDSLYGGKDLQTDIFEFDSISDSVVGLNRDLIYDFTLKDKIDLVTIDANIKLAGDQAFSFGGNGARNYGVWFKVGDADGDGQANDIIVYGDVNGNTTADFEIGIVGASSLRLTSSNFDL
jgi:hypothetical protein